MTARPAGSLLLRRGVAALACVTGLLSAARAQAPAAAPPSPRVPAAAEPAAGQPQRFPGEVDLVMVDVVVTDKKGNPVTGLTQADFTVEEEGVRQMVSSFEAVNLPAAPSGAAGPRARVSTNTQPRLHSSRTFLILFDDVHLLPEDAAQAKGAVAAFLREGVREGDYVSLLASSGETWWNTRMEGGRSDLLAVLARLEGRRMPDMRMDRLSDWEAMRVAQYNDTLVAERVYRRYQTLQLTKDAAFPTNRVEQTRSTREEENELYFRGVNELMVETRAAETYRLVRDRGNRALATLKRALESLVSARGRKALVLVSDGFILDHSLDGFRDAVQSARRSNVTIYFVDTRGLKGLGGVYGANLVEAAVRRDVGAALADLTQEAAGAEHLANDTGGFSIHSTNDLAGGIQRIARESLSYYLLGYDPSARPRDGRYRRIKVSTRLKDVTVRARRGYFAPREGEADAPATRTTADADLQRALDSPYPTDEIPVRMTAYVRDEVLVGRARTLLAAEIGIKDLAFREREDGRRVGTLNLLLTVAHRDSSDFQREDKAVEIVLRPGGAGQQDQAWYAVSREFQLERGSYQAKLVVRDPQDRRLGAVTHEFDVPGLEGLRVSTPILSDRLQAADAKSAPAPLPLARRDFPSGSPLFCQFEVYGASRGEITGMPQVSAGYALVAADGRTLASSEPTAIRPTSLGYLSRLWAMGLGDVAPGSYELVITVQDEVTGRREVLHEPFTVTGQTAPGP
jgi:VWFA-related protein